MSASTQAKENWPSTGSITVTLSFATGIVPRRGFVTLLPLLRAGLLIGLTRVSTAAVRRRVSLCNWPDLWPRGSWTRIDRATPRLRRARDANM